MTERTEVVNAAIEGVRHFTDTIRGARMVKEIRPQDDHSFTVVLHNGDEIHFNTVIV